MNNIYAEANHPITCANPERYFKVIEWKTRSGNLYVRGEGTMWFHSTLCKFWSEEEVRAFRRELAYG